MFVVSHPHSVHTGLLPERPRETTMKTKKQRKRAEGVHLNATTVPGRVKRYKVAKIEAAKNRVVR